jgi:thiol-disulfide isomerase/thioredoxin
MIWASEGRLDNLLRDMKCPLLGHWGEGIPPEKLSQRRLEAFQAAKQYYEKYDDMPQDRRDPMYQNLRAYLATIPWPKERQEYDRWNAVYKGPVPQPAPELTVEWIGKPRTLADFRGRVVLLAFWGMRCGTCMNAMPDLQRLQETYEGRGLSVVAVHSQSDQNQQAREYVKEHGCTFSVCFPTSSDLFSKYLVQGLPAYYLIDRQGRLVWGPKRKLPSDKRIMDLLSAEPKNGASNGESDATQPAAQPVESQPATVRPGSPQTHPATRTVSSAHIGTSRACGCKLRPYDRPITLAAVTSPPYLPSRGKQKAVFSYICY